MNARTDRHIIHAAGGTRRYVLVTLNAPEQTSGVHRLPVNVSLVLDRSGSMSGEKMAMVRAAAARALQTLRPEDRFSLVVFDEEINVLVESTYATNEAVRHGEGLLDAVHARGQTNLFTAWMRGCEQVAPFAHENAICKCLLLTDGLANSGITDRDEIAGHAAHLRDMKVRTSTFGVGARFNELLLNDMARAGGGEFYFIERAAQISELLASELGETLEVVARDVQLFINLPHGASAEMLSDFPRAAATTHVWRLGDLVSRQQLSVLLEITFPAGAPGTIAELTVDLRSVDAEALQTTPQTVTWTFARESDTHAQPRDVIVDREVAGTYEARAHREALERNRQGDFQGASTIISRTAHKIHSYAGNDSFILKIARRLEREAADYLERLAPMAMKQRQYDSKNVLKHRDSSGKSRRAGRGETYSLDTATGHPVIDLGGVRALVDTGSPLSFGKPLSILGDSHHPGPGLGIVNVEEISRCIGERIDVLLGTDILAQYSFTIDWDGGRISFTRDTDPLPGGRIIDTSLRHGVPCLEFATGAGSALAFFDTGAKLSYMDPRAVNGTRSLGEEEDFFPAVGRFRVPVYQKEVSIAGLPLVMKFGVLPAALSMVLGLAGVHWILGSELLRGREVQFDLGQGRISIGQ